MDPLAMGIYLVGIVMLVGGVLYFILRKKRRGIVIAVLGLVIAIVPFALNIWLAHGS